VTLFDKYKDAEPDPDALPIVMRLAIRGTPDEIRRLRQKLDEWMEDCKSLSSERDDAPDMLSYSGLLAFYPRPDDE